MIKTYDFLLTAKRDKDFRAQLEQAISSDTDRELCTDIHKLVFCAADQTVTITAKSSSSPFKEKIIPKKVTYRALMQMLSNEWDRIAPNDITDL